MAGLVLFMLAGAMFNDVTAAGIVGAIFSYRQTRQWGWSQATEGRTMERVLQEFARYLRQRLLLLEQGVGAYVRWAREFLVFARPFRELGFDECLERFLAELARTPERPAWELGQAKDAVRVYYYQFRRAGQPAKEGEGPNVPELLEQMRTVIRRRHAA